jgi:Cu/Ag efflux protein CusF
MKILFQRRILIVLCALTVIGLIIAVSGTWFLQKKEYPLQGQIVDLIPERHKVIVAHDDIPGYMQAMTMSFVVKDGEKYEELSPGDEITATLVVQENRSWLQKIRIVRKAVN